MKQTQPSAPVTDNQISALSDNAQLELDRIAHGSQVLRDHLVELLAENSALRLERDKLMHEMDNVRGGVWFRLGALPGRVALALQRALFPVGIARRRALRVLAAHRLDPVVGFERLVFAPGWYRTQIGDGQQGMTNADPVVLLKHYIASGEAQGLRPTPLFDPGHYAAQVPNLVPGKARALMHFLEHGLLLGLAPNADLVRLILQARVDGMTPAVWLYHHKGSA